MGDTMTRHYPMLTRNCSECGEAFEYPANASRAMVCKKPECKKGHDRKYKQGRRDRPYLTNDAGKQPVEPIFRVVIGGILRRALRDATLEFDDELGEEIPPEVRQEARLYLYEDAPDILACMGIQIELPAMLGD